MHQYGQQELQWESHTTGYTASNPLKLQTRMLFPNDIKRTHVYILIISLQDHLDCLRLIRNQNILLVHSKSSNKIEV